MIRERVFIIVMKHPTFSGLSSVSAISLDNPGKKSAEIASLGILVSMAHKGSHLF